MESAIDLIASGLPDEGILGFLKPCNTVCAFTGKQITQGVPTKTALSGVFTDHQYLKYKSSFISLQAAKCLMGVIEPKKGEEPEADSESDEGESSPKKVQLNATRNYSFIATRGNFRILKQVELEEVVLNLPNEPFVFVVTYSNKKHVSFKSHLNFSPKSFFIDTDRGSFFIDDFKLFENLLAVAKRWYSVIIEKADKADKPTYFTKAEISGQEEIGTHKMLDYCNRYGTEQFMAEYDFLQKHHNTPLINFISFIITKNVRN